MSRKKKSSINNRPLIFIALGVVVVLLAFKFSPSYLNEGYPAIYPTESNTSEEYPEPTQTQNTKSETVYKFHDLSFKIPVNWWSRTVPRQTDWEGAFQMDPEKMCWGCDTGSAISITFSENADLQKRMNEAIKDAYLKEVVTKNISIENREATLLEGKFDPPEDQDIPVSRNAIYRLLYIQNGKNLYVISQITDNYKKEFEQIVDSLKFSK